MSNTTRGDRALGIEVEQRGRTLVGRLHGGPRGEMGPEIAHDLERLVTRAETDDGVGAVVLIGTHPTRFVGHASLPWLQEGGAAAPAVTPRIGAAVVRTALAARRLPGGRKAAGGTPLDGVIELVDLHKTYLRMNRCGAVFIAALNGSALGIGSELALACDKRLMASGDIFIGQPEVLLGFPPGGGGTQRLTRLVGPRHALRIMLEGAAVDPAEALEIGYVDEVVAPEELLDRATALGDHLAGRMKPAVAAVKRAVHIGGSLDLEAGLLVENAEFFSTLTGPEAQRTMLAYIRQTDAKGDLPLYEPATYAHARRAGRFIEGPPA